MVDSKCHIWHRENCIDVLQTDEFSDWLLNLPLKDQALVNTRLARIETFGHLGNWKYLKNIIAELKWRNGLRVYFSKLGNKLILIINGGRKNGQKKDIQKAHKILKRYAFD